MSLSVGAGMAIAGGISAAAGGANVAFQTKLNKKNREWQDQVRLQQRKWSLQDWERETAYNDPSAVLKRYSDAGVNKTFALTQGQSVQAPATKSADTPSAEQRAPQINSPISMADMLNATSLKSQIDKTNAETGHIQSQTALTDLKLITERYSAVEQEYKAAIASNDYEMAKELFNQKVEYQGLINASLRAQTQSTLKGIGLTDAEIAKVYQDMDYQKKQFNHQVWKDVQDNKRGWFDSNTGRRRLNLESPWFGRQKEPWWSLPTGESGEDGTGFYENADTLVKRVLKLLTPDYFERDSTGVHRRNPWEKR